MPPCLHATSAGGQSAFVQPLWLRDCWQCVCVLLAAACCVLASTSPPSLPATTCAACRCQSVACGCCRTVMPTLACPPAPTLLPVQGAGLPVHDA